MISRRAILGSLGASLLGSPATAQRIRPYQEPYELPYGLDPYGEEDQGPSDDFDDWYVGVIPDRPYNVPVVDLERIDPQFHLQTVPYGSPEPPGTIIIDTSQRFLYLTQPGQTALRYGIGVGRQGFAWSGVAKVKRKAKWPSWRPPAEMLRRRPDLPSFMQGGLDNPLGARALYLYQGERDTLYRIHGTNEPNTIGHAVSSGCIRLLNQDVYDLYDRVAVGTMVKVLQHRALG